MLFIFLLPEQKKNETKRKFAVCIFLPTPVLFSAKEKELATAIRYAHRNSLLIFLIEVWSNSFFFLTLQKAPPLHGKKKRPDLDAFAGKGRDNIAPLVGVNGKHPPQTTKRIIHPWGEHHSTEHIHLNERSNVESSVGGPAFSGGA